MIERPELEGEMSVQALADSLVVREGFRPETVRPASQSTGIDFPTAGCWKVLGRVDDKAKLTFVTLVRKV